MVWPCKTCKNYSTNPDGCSEDAPVRPKQTFEEELLEALTRPLSDYPEGGVLICGMTGINFPGVDNTDWH